MPDSIPGLRVNTVYEAPRAAPRSGELIITSTCGHNCGGRCVVNAHVTGGRITRISTDMRRWDPDHPPLPACARGVGQIERTYHPDRLRYPLRRIGARGSGQFGTCIGWDEALDTVAREMLRVRATYGNAAILDGSRSGSQSQMLHGRVAAQRFLNMFGGCTELWSNMSSEAEIFAVRMTYGSEYKSSGREPTDYINSKLILMWGWSPGDGTFGTGTMPYLKWAKQNGTKIICVDPRRTMTSRQLADEHIFIRPSTDAAALIAMTREIVARGLHDQAFCDRYVLGFDEAHLPDGARRGSSYRDYLFGSARVRNRQKPRNGPLRSPACPLRLSGSSRWNSPPANRRRCRPAMRRAGHCMASSFHRAAYALAAITGNVGIAGGSSGTSNGATGRMGIKSLPIGTNPTGALVSTPLLADLLARGKAGGYRPTSS